jgi:Domain of unknown function (DUF4278)
MKLIYRGIPYDRNSSEFVASRPFQSLRSSRAVYNLTYRGATYTVVESAKQTKFPTKSVTHKLSYRGLAYLANQNA